MRFNFIKWKLQLSDRWKLWLSNIRKNWISYIVDLILYLIPVAVIEPSISTYFVGEFKLIMSLLGIIFFFNEVIKSNELIKNDLELKKYEEKIKKLQGECNELECYSESIGFFLENLPKKFLRSVSEFLELKNSERISLYVWDEEQFSIIGRYSENPKYNRIARDAYPSDKGYISKCLENYDGRPYYARENLPKRHKQYLKCVLQDSGMNEEDINSLSMKSRSYFNRVIRDGYRENIGILVIESMNARLPMKAEELNRKLEELSISHMSTLLDVSKKLKGGESDE